MRLCHSSQESWTSSTHPRPRCTLHLQQQQKVGKRSFELDSPLITPRPCSPPPAPPPRKPPTLAGVLGMLKQRFSVAKGEAQETPEVAGSSNSFSAQQQQLLSVERSAQSVPSLPALKRCEPAVPLPCVMP